ncbi:MAG: hypothetical protein KVP17_001592 [Porospora cf. gigantea B]|uniref:uncharacterized protein n=1 Tax=Porospora cf. gigantea B TaxID=2853592 RepID=UPI0035718DC1|nr:MAG: hypothetical protein KVP17_001592 [Porospora cf. gigantea B]
MSVGTRFWIRLIGFDYGQYTALKKTGSVLKVMFRSAQQCGRADESHGFWVCALLSHEGAYLRVNCANCSLAKLPRWGERPFEAFPCLLVKNFDMSHFESFSNHVRRLGIHMCGMLGDGDKLTVDFQSAADGEAFRKQFHGQAAWAEQDKVLECSNQRFLGPPSVYDTPEDAFQSLITTASLDELHFENKEYDENDENSRWDTEAVYTLEMEDAAYLEHIKEGDVWYGR